MVYNVCNLSRHRLQALILQFIVFDWPQGELLVPDLKNKVEKACLLGDSKREPLAVSQSEKGVKIKLPGVAPDKMDSVIVLEL